MAGEKLNEWTGRLPELEDGRRFPGVEREVAEGIYGEVLGMADGLKVLADGLQEVDDGGDWKVRFLVRGLVNSVGAGGDAKVEAGLVAAAMDADRGPGVRAFLLEQVRFIAGEASLAAVVPALGEVDERLTDAAAAVIVTVGGDAAKAALRGAMENVAPARRVVLENALKQVG